MENTIAVNSALIKVISFIDTEVETPENATVKKEYKKSKVSLRYKGGIFRILLVFFPQKLLQVGLASQ